MLIGLVGWQVVFASYSLMIAAISVLFLGERVGWRRWLAISAGFVGVVLALEPGSSVFSIEMILPILGAAQFAAYGILTPMVGRSDPAATSFFWTGVVGALAITMTVPFAWNPPVGTDLWWMLMLCLTGTVGHFLMIKALEVAEAGMLQPFAYFGIAVSAAIGYFGFGDAVTPAMLAGGAIISGAGLFTFWLERVASARGQRRIVSFLVRQGAASTPQQSSSNCRIHRPQRARPPS